MAAEIFDNEIHYTVMCRCGFKVAGVQKLETAEEHKRIHDSIHHDRRAERRDK